MSCTRFGRTFTLEVKANKSPVSRRAAADLCLHLASPVRGRWAAPVCLYPVSRQGGQEPGPWEINSEPHGCIPGTEGIVRDMGLGPFWALFLQKL